APDVDQPVFDVQAPDAQAAAQPSAPLEGDALDALGGLIAFMRMAERLAHESTDARTPVQWAAWLGDAFANAFDAHDGDLPSAQRIRAALRRLADDAARGGCASTLPYAVARERLAHALAAQKPGAVPTGAITFASMGPLRAVPFRVVALLGLDDGAFPRPVVPLEFDLMARAPRIGDRDRRHDDRATLLDALLDAQDALILGCTVRDARDDTDRPPSVLVEELVDFIAAASDWPRDRVWARLAIEHALHGFGPVAFAPLAPASYVQPWRDAAACLAAPLHTRHARLLAPEPLPEDETSAASPIDAARLVGWLAHPARHFLRDRLRLALDDDARVLDDEEPFALSARDASALRWRIAEAFERGRSRDDAARVVMAGVELPAGRAGEVALRGLLDEASAWQRVHADTTHRLGEALPPRALECRIGARVVTATMHGLHGTNTAAPHALLISRPDVLGKGPQARVRVRIEAWIAHLLAQCAYGRVATLVAGIDHMFALAPCENAPALLGVLLDDYQRAQRSPLICPPKTAWRVARGESLDAAQRACWAPQDFGEGEADDPWWRMLLGDAWSRVPRAADFPGATSTFGDDDFATLVERLYVPMAQAIVETVKGVDEIVQQVLA
ncbi:MAG TPA: hypothetical protein VFS42_01355, partial [Burkholderiaceae bacterium]|nr:hypothetical protein [Burkholderiaceae bacterium]